MKNLLLYMMMLGLAGPAALAARPTKKGKGPNPTAIQPQRTPSEAADMKKVCEQKPMAQIAEPKKPTNANIDLTAEIPDSKADELMFDNHCKDAAGRVRGCDITLARSYIAYYRAKHALEGELKTVCEEMKTKVEQCQTQAESRECAGKIYRGAAEKFNEVKARLDKDAQQLRAYNADHKKLASDILNPTARAKTAAASTITDSTKRTAAKTRLEGEANNGVTPVRATLAGQNAHTSSCLVKVGNQAFCSHITAAADAAYYTVNLKKASDQTGSSAANFTKLANQSSPNGPNGNTNGDDKSKGGLLDSVGGLDGLMKMATLGMMGAGMYCQMSGQCGNQSQSGLPQDPAANSGLAATSPTPSSANNGPQTSSLGDNNSKGGSSTPPSADFKTDTTTNTGTDPFAGGSGFSSPSDHEALNNFQGELGRGPASASAAAPGGGGGTGAESSGASSPPGELAADGSKAAGSPEAGGLGPISGGGGLPAAGGFSLSSSPDAPAADAALKDILNGDGPGDAGLASMLDDPNGVGGLGANGDAELQDSESLFFRIRDTHVRCVKRGCVGREVGDKI